MGAERKLKKAKSESTKKTLEKQLKSIKQAQSSIKNRPDTPMKTIVVKSINYPVTHGHWAGLDKHYNAAKLKDAFAARFTGTLHVPKTGYYNFWTKSDDGSKLWVDGKEVVNNDGMHAMREKKGRVHLRSGNAKIK